jgi:hypothetical protein
LQPNLFDNQDEVLEDFIEIVHNDLLIHPASPLTIHEIACNAYDCKLKMPNQSPKTTIHLILTTLSPSSKKTPTKSFASLVNPLLL